MQRPAVLGWPRPSVLTRQPPGLCGERMARLHDANILRSRSAYPSPTWYLSGLVQIVVVRD